MSADKVESFLVNIIPGAYTSTYSFLLLIAWKINFDSSRQPFVLFLLNMFCNDWIPFCSRNLFLSSVSLQRTKQKEVIFIFNLVLAKYTVFVCRAVTVSIHIAVYWKYTKSELRQCYSETIYIYHWYIFFCSKHNFEGSIHFISFFVSDVSSPLLGEQV